MSKALILNFSSFESKKNNKFYCKFDLYDVASRSVYNIFTESAFLQTPGGTIPTKEEEQNDFPRVAEVDFTFRQFQTKDGQVQYRPDCSAIKKWSKLEIKDLK